MRLHEPSLGRTRVGWQELRRKLQYERQWMRRGGSGHWLDRRALLSETDVGVRRRQPNVSLNDKEERLKYHGKCSLPANHLVPASLICSVNEQFDTIESKASRGDDWNAWATTTMYSFSRQRRESSGS